jgi:hypothetical protein
MTTSVRTAWEYKVEALNIDPIDPDTDLNEFGAEGWELVSIQPNHTPGAAKFLCIFKRSNA